MKIYSSKDWGIKNGTCPLISNLLIKKSTYLSLWSNSWLMSCFILTKFYIDEIKLWNFFLNSIFLGQLQYSFHSLYYIEIHRYYVIEYVLYHAKLTKDQRLCLAHFMLSQAKQQHMYYRVSKTKYPFYFKNQNTVCIG